MIGRCLTVSTDWWAAACNQHTHTRSPLHNTHPHKDLANASNGTFPCSFRYHGMIIGTSVEMLPAASAEYIEYKLSTVCVCLCVCVCVCVCVWLGRELAMVVESHRDRL